MTNFKRGASALGVIVGALVGLVVGYWGAGSKGGLAPKAVQLKAALNAIEREHVALASEAVRNGYDKRSQFGASADALDMNSKALAEAVGSVYGKEAGDKFLEIWRSHIGFFVNYATALKSGNKAEQDKAVADLGGYADGIADFLATPTGLGRDAIKGLIMEHVGHLKAMADAHAAGKYPDSYAREHEAGEHIGTIADTLADAIVKSKSDMFK